MLESLFDKVADRKTSLYLKETSTRVFLGILRNFLIVNLHRHLSIFSMLNQKQCGTVCTKKGRSGHSPCYLHISRNYSNMLLLINLQKRTT